MKITIQGKLTTLNEYTLKQRSNKFAGNSIKQKNTNNVLIQLPNSSPFSKPVFIRLDWFVKDKRGDADNICFAKKFILDAMVKKGILKNDNLNNVVGFLEKFYIDKNERVEIEILETNEI